MSRSIAKNTAFITTAMIGQKIISFIYFTLIARHIGAESTGKYFFALSFTTIFVVFIDLGLTQVLIREGAKLKNKIQDYFSSIIFAKLFFGLLTYLAAIITINAMGYPVETKHLVYLSAVTMLFDSLHLTIYGILRSLGNLRYEAFGIIGSQFLTLILGTSFLYLGFPLIFLILAFTIPSFLNAIYATSVLFFKYKIKLKPKYNKEILKFFARISAPFALAAIFARVYSYIDSILLSKLINDTEVGIYSIPYKITYSFQFIPLALVAALYPSFSEFFISNKKRLAYIFERGVKYLLIIVFPIAFGIIILAKDIIISIYTTEYSASVFPLRILLVGLIFSFLSFPLGAMLNACNRQKSQTVIIFFVMIVNIITNIIFIPKFGASGAALAALIGNFFLVFSSVFVLRQITKISYFYLTKNLMQIIFSALVMAFVVWQANQYTHYLGAIAVGAIVYSLMLFITRTITREQLREAFVLIKK